MEGDNLLWALNLERVPVVMRNITIPEHMPNIETAVEFSIGKSCLNDIQREGVILRPYIERTDYELGRLSFKIVNPKFLLKYEKDEK